MNTSYVGKGLWFVAGVGIGAGATWLFATRGGRKARRQVAHMVKDGREYIVKAGESACETGKEFYERGKEFAEDARERIESGLRAVR